MINFYRLPFVIALFALAGCSDEPKRIVVTLFDITGSGTPDIDRVRREARVVVSTLRVGTDTQAGDRLIGDAIGSYSWQGAELQLDATFGRLDRNHSNARAHARKAKELRDSITVQVDSLLATPAAGESDLLGAFEVPARLFAGHPESEKVLVVFSDMLHLKKDGIDFASPEFTIERAEALVGELDAQGRIPDLTGVVIYISGFGASGQLRPEQLQALETFWNGYFSKTGASSEKKHVGPTLINWPSS